MQQVIAGIMFVIAPRPLHAMLETMSISAGNVGCIAMSAWHTSAWMFAPVRQQHAC